MSIKSRLIITLSGTTFAFLLISGIMTFFIAEDQITNRVQEQLVGIAAIQKERILETTSLYRERARLIFSRTQLRNNIRDSASDPNKELTQNINNILADAKKSIEGISKISVSNSNGLIVGSTDNSEIGKEILRSAYYTKAQEQIHIESMFVDSEDVQQLRVVGPLIISGETIGVGEVIMHPSQLLAIASDYTGLGQTGEVLIIQIDTDEQEAKYLHPLRFKDQALLQTVTEVDTSSMSVVTKDNNIHFNRDLTDYRHQKVLAATNFIPEVGWGVIAKIDTHEALMTTNIVMQGFGIIIFISIILAIIVSYLLARSISQPISTLVKGVNEIEKGNYKHRIDPKGVTEIKTLAQTFNTMAENISTSQKHLEEKVADRTRELENAKRKLEERLEETQRLNKIMVDRELKMIELKKKLKDENN